MLLCIQDNLQQINLHKNHNFFDLFKQISRHALAQRGSKVLATSLSPFLSSGESCDGAFRSIDPNGKLRMCALTCGVNLSRTVFKVIQIKALPKRKKGKKNTVAH